MNSSKLACLSVLLSFLAASATAQTSPLRFSIQGTLKDGMSMAIPDGNYSLTFKLYDAPTGGSIVWQEVADVAVKGGLYSYLLGSVNPLNPADFGKTLYVGVQAEGYDFLPRTELTYSPAAMYVHFAGNGFPAGAVIPYPSAVIPAGWLLCNGQALSSSSHPSLYAAIGTIYGNGSTGINGGAGKNFNLPDLRGEFIRGQDNGRGVDPGRQLGTNQGQATKMPDDSPFSQVDPLYGYTNAGGNHTHGMSNTYLDAKPPNPPFGGSVTHLHTNSTVFASGPVGDGNTGNIATSDAGDHLHTATLTGGGDAETRPRNVSMNYIIKL